MKRRDILASSCGLLLAGSIPSASADTLPASIRSFAAILSEIGGKPVASFDVEVSLPKHIEDGRSVPVTVSTRLPDVSQLFVLVEVNPEPLAIKCRIPAGTVAELSTRIKLAATGRVYGVARSRGQLFWAWQDAAVTTGGCS